MFRDRNVYFKVEHKNNPHFYGRQDLLKTIASNFKEKIPLQIIAGPEGCGKTEIGVEYSFQHMKEYSTIWRFNSASINEDFAEFLSTIRLSFQMPNNPDYIWLRTFESLLNNHNIKTAEFASLTQNEKIEVIKILFQNIPDWLIIFEDFKDEDQVKMYLPEQNPKLGQHILITSRFTNWPNNHVVQLNEFSRNEALEFLQKRLPSTNLQDLTMLSQVVGGSPLALDQACVYCKRCGISVNSYIKHFRENRQELAEAERKNPPIFYTYKDDKKIIEETRNKYARAN